MERGDLFGKPATQRGRRYRVVTEKNRRTPFTREQREAELDKWWEAAMEKIMPQLAQDWITARGSAIASKSGINVNEIGPEMELLDSLGQVRLALAATKGLAITGEELADKIIKEAKVLEERSQIPHLAPQLAALIVITFAQERGLSEKTKTGLLDRIRQKRLPNF